MRDVVPRGKDACGYKHGHWNHPLYGTWRNMVDRCENPQNKSYKNYGGRGIAVCATWHDIGVFIADMGPRPPGGTLERSDNERGYEPGNCIWASRTAQARNRRIVKLTPGLATRMRLEPRRAKNGRGPGMLKSQIAAKYGVSTATVKKVLSGDYWKIAPHVADMFKKEKGG